MRRWLATLLLVLLPFQFSWAAVGGYCQHETGAAAKHFGHHNHQHETHPGDAGEHETPKGNVLGAVDSDCSACHAASVAALPDFAALPALAASSFAIPWFPASPAAPPDAQPERPNWIDLA
ncbi:MAG: hypothetical protein BGO63_15135 [Candidatus Accumulibacter sp. 66-26]|nr:hypothetical protein [Accumulibacter sp.]OJW48672.1 MAG: hypothetical protein BGO63_15135 [Candidatus Accumulibacter sp. 66-26]